MIKNKKQNIVFIHRGRNQKSKDIGRLFTNIDYNFDYRGKNRIFLILKAMLTVSEIPKADIYFVEGGICLNAAYFVKLFRAKKAKIILMIPEPFFNLDKMKGIKLWWVKKMLSKVDAVIAISDLVKEDAKKYFSGPIEIAHHPVLNINRFKNVSIAWNKKRLVYVVERPLEVGQIKGLDIAVKSFKIAKKRISDLELWLVGSGTENLDYNIRGIKYLGYQKIEDVFSKSQIIISPSRYDAFNLAVAEASLCGLLPIVSNKTGAREFIKKVDASLVINSFDPKEYAEKIINLFNTNPSELKKISSELKKEVSYYNEKNCFIEYKKAMKKIMAKLFR